MLAADKTARVARDTVLVLDHIRHAKKRGHCLPKDFWNGLNWLLSKLFN
jgi:hypothetical protein